VPEDHQATPPADEERQSTEDGQARITVALAVLVAWRRRAGRMRAGVVTSAALVLTLGALLVSLLPFAPVAPLELFGPLHSAPAMHVSSTATVAATPTPTPQPQPFQMLDLTRYVNPFVGTGAGGQDFGFGAAGGNTFPGATLPFGMTQFSPDTASGRIRPSGYGYADSIIRGFSLTHLSGAGCPIFGDIPFMPATGSVANAVYGAGFSHRDESASPGAYSVRLTNGIYVELTATLRTGFARVTFPAGLPRTLLLAAGSDLRGAQAAHTQIVSPTEIAGSVTSGPFCSFLRTTYTVYFDAQVNRQPASFGAWQGGAWPGARTANGAGSGVYLQFASHADATMLLKVGLSYVSAANARANLAAENPGWDFDGVRAAAGATWNDLLNHAQATGGSAQDERTFYTALYHALLAPNIFSDVNSQYPGFDGRIHTAQGYTQYANFSSWDIYRSEVPLLALIAPLQASDMMQSLVADGQQAGALPRWPLANSETGIMIGDSPTVILAEGEAFGAREFDTGAALRLVIAGATHPGIGAGGSVERAGLSAYLRLGYVPLGAAWVPVSNSLEYYTDDYAIACLARDLGQVDTARQFVVRAENWPKIYNPAPGYMQPRTAGGGFAPVDPTDSDIYVEGDAWQYTWMVNFDAGGLVAHLGGSAAAQRRLDDFFRQLNAGPAAPHAYMGNEPSLGAPWMYDFMGAPQKTQATVRRVMTQLYGDSPQGLPGNDDLGAMSSWYVWAALGMYPLLPGRAGFVLGSPLFPQVTLTVMGRHVRLEAPGAGRGAPYVGGMRIDGAPTTSLWLPLTRLATASEIAYDMAASPDAGWGRTSADAPPSVTTDAWLTTPDRPSKGPLLGTY
jgi:predicted alpha-1,2-mannosidase